VVIALLAYGGYHLFFAGGDTVQTTPPVPVITTPKPAPKPAPQPVVAPPQAATPSPAMDNTNASANAPAPGQQQAAATTSPAAGPTSPATHIAPSTATAQPGQAAVQPAKPGTAPAPSNGQVYGINNRSPRVVLRARGDMRLTVRGPDGQIYLNRDLKAGDSYQVPNIPGLSMATSDGGAVEVDLDGSALGRAGQHSQVLGKVSLDPQSLADRFNNH